MTETGKGVAAAMLGIALFAMMDAYMKGLTLALGAFSAMVWRLLIALGAGAIIFGLASPGLPDRAQMRLHLMRGSIAPLMAVTFFFGIARVPLAEGIALSFIAPLIGLYLAAVLLGEQIGRQAVLSSLAGLAGVAVILAGRWGAQQASPDYWLGVGAILISAVLYAWNLILQRQQAMLSSPSEIVFFQHLVALGSLLLYGLVLYPLLLWLWRQLGGEVSATFVPQLLVPPTDLWITIATAAMLTISALWVLAWAYARAEAQVLMPVEYSAFAWAALFGWLWYDEAVTLSTIAGTILIVAACLLTARQKPPPAAPELF